MVYAPYAFMWTDLKGDIRELRQDTRELRQDTKEITKGLARLEAHFRTTEAHPDSVNLTNLSPALALAPRTGAESVVLSVLDAALCPGARQPVLCHVLNNLGAENRRLNS